MCNVCGCGTDEVQIDLEKHPDLEHSGREGHSHAHGHSHGHSHSHSHGETAEGDLDFGRGGAGVHIGGMDPVRMVQIEQDILGKNDRYAAANRDYFAQAKQFVLNLVSSPGSGKTTLLVETLKRLKGRVPLAVLEGDQQTANDADRIRAVGVPAVQINTGKGCHLDAHMVGHAVERLELSAGGLLFIENVGNLVCPAAFDLGEGCRVAMLSVTEGEDKPIKYPNLFAGADLVLINKIDLLPYLEFDLPRCLEYLRSVNPAAEVLEISCTKPGSLDNWCGWLLDQSKVLLEKSVG